MKLSGHQLDGFNAALKSGNDAKAHLELQTACAVADGVVPLAAASGSVAEKHKITIEELERILSSGGKPAIEIQPDGSIKAVPMAGKMTAIIDAAVELVAFIRTNEYPKEGTPQFFKLNELADRLDTALRREHL